MTASFNKHVDVAYVLIKALANIDSQNKVI